MKLLTDQDVYAGTVRLLRAAGHDVVTAGDFGLGQAPDSDLLRAAQAQARILVTRDRDFGNLVFAQSLQTGVLYLRMTPSTQTVVHDELTRVLAQSAEAELLRAFVVVEAGRHRTRHFEETDRPANPAS